MTRTIRPETLAALMSAAHEPDCQLDLALLRAGVLAPVDLSEIRRVLSIPGSSVVPSSISGCRRLLVICDDHIVASIEHDGSVMTPDTVAA